MFDLKERKIEYDERKRYPCPFGCGGVKTFGRDKNNPEVGTCFRCDNTMTWGRWVDLQSYSQPTIQQAFSTLPPKQAQEPQRYIDENVLLKTVSEEHWERNPFILFLLENFDNDRVVDVLNKYRVGTARSQVFDGEKVGGTVFWYIDERGRICKPKVMYYEQETGKRIKSNDSGPPFNTGGFTNENHYRYSCLFGEHRLNELKKNDGKLFLVESEKTAIICAVYFGGVWLATGGAQAKKDKLFQLKNYAVSIWTDMDEPGLQWGERIDKYLTRIGCKSIRVNSDRQPELSAARVLLLQHKDALDGTDMADIVLELNAGLVEEKREAKTKPEPEESEPTASSSKDWPTELTQIDRNNWIAPPSYWPDGEDAFCRAGIQTLAEKANATLSRRFNVELIAPGQKTKFEPNPDYAPVTPEVMTVCIKQMADQLNPRQNFELWEGWQRAGVRSPQLLGLFLKEQGVIKRDAKGLYSKTDKRADPAALSEGFTSYLLNQ